MELPNRDREEEAITLLLLTVFEEWERDLLRVGYIPWEAYRLRVQTILTARLAAVFLFMVLLFAREKKFQVDNEATTAFALGWAGIRAGMVANNLKASVQQAYNVAINAFYGDGRVSLRELLSGLLDRSRASTIATTEVTQAQSAGNIRAVQEFQQQSGIALEGVWITELAAFGRSTKPGDGGVCPICFPLHAQPRAVWGDRFPLGPPAHPNCRCHLEFQ